MGKTQLNPERHGMAWQGNDMGAAWERNGMCELAFRFPEINPFTPDLNPSAQRWLPRFFAANFNS
jgi:hypothetical protein